MATEAEVKKMKNYQKISNGLLIAGIILIVLTILFTFLTVEAGLALENLSEETTSTATSTSSAGEEIVVETTSAFLVALFGSLGFDFGLIFAILDFLLAITCLILCGIFRSIVRKSGVDTSEKQPTK